MFELILISAGLLLYSCLLFRRAWLAEQKIHELISALRMEHAPDAPCVNCKSECSHACTCSCHRERVKYLSILYDNLLEKTYREFPHVQEPYDEYKMYLKNLSTVTPARKSS